MATRTYERDDLYPICSKLLDRVPACIVWLYYACSYTVGISSGRIPSFAVLHTEDCFSVCSTAKLGIGLGDKVRCTDFFFPT